MEKENSIEQDFLAALAVADARRLRKIVTAIAEYPGAGPAALAWRTLRDSIRAEFIHRRGGPPPTLGIIEAATESELLLAGAFCIEHAEQTSRFPREALVFVTLARVFQREAAVTRAVAATIPNSASVN